MREIAIVRRRTRVWPIVLMLLLLAAIVVVALWMMGYLGPVPEEFRLNVGRILSDPAVHHRAT
jgi:hypothetical protein